MVYISPSLLAADPLFLGRDALRMQDAGADFLHVDCMDGVFVPNLSFGPAAVAALKAAVRLPLDVHIMQTHPERWIDRYAEAGAAMITVHAEATPHLQRALSQIRARGCRAGVSLCPATPLEAVRYVLDDLDLLLVMSVNPGYGGQSYLPQMTGKIRDARSLLDRAGSSAYLAVDGGVTEGNAAEITSAGATLLIAGTSLLNSRDPRKAMDTLRGNRAGA